MADSPRSILARLEQLKQWQEQQQRALLEKHSAQQQLLEREQQKMYQVLGLQLNQHFMDGDDDEGAYSEDDDTESEYEETNLEAQLASERLIPTINNATGNYSAVLPEDAYPRDDEENLRSAVQKRVPKRPFLKRGEGLRSRFRVDPDKFKLDNLPKYKFANHNRDRMMRKGLGPKRESSKPADDKPSSGARRTSSSRVDVAKAEQKIEPSAEKKKARNKSDTGIGIVLDVDKVQDKKLKLTRRQGGGSLPVLTDEVRETVAPQTEEGNTNPVVPGPKVLQPIRPMTAGPSGTAPWKRRLDAAPTTDGKEQRELNFFELLEQKVIGKSFNSNSSSILRFIAANDTTANDSLMTMQQQNGTDHTLEQEEPVGPLVRQDEVAPIAHISPAPSQLALSVTIDSDDNDDEPLVRFAEDRTGHTTTNHPDSDTSDIVDQRQCLAGLRAISLDQMSTPNDKFVMRQSVSPDKTELDSSACESSVEDETEETGAGLETEGESTAVPAGTNEDDTLRSEILAKSELLKERLVELEREIDSYRRENAELIRLKQDHELERLKLQQDREEQEERLNDERIKMEVYFHDERMKIESERKQALREAAKPNRKDREEILRLTEELADLRRQHKEREAKHSASLARFRAHSKTMEKDLAEVRLELEVLKKDNRRLETENARLKRQNNSRMLVEINRNIAKLATGGGEPAGEEPQDTKVSQGKPTSGFAGAQKKTPLASATSKIVARPVKISERRIREPPTRAKVLSHGARVPATRGHSDGPVRMNDAMSSETDENDENRPLAGASSDEDNFFDDNDEDENDSEHGEDSSSAFDGGDHEPSPYFTKPVAPVRKTLFSAESVHQDESVTPVAAAAANGVRPQRATKSIGASADVSEVMSNLKREIVNADGSRDIWYPNGNLKKISPDGLMIRMLYFNKDIKETNVSEGTTRYYYFETNTWHTTYLDGLEILEFPDGQTQHRFKDGSTEVHFQNGSIRTTNPNSADIAEEWKYPDGTTVVIRKNDDKEITLPNGQVEIHTKAHKRRIYPDGTVKFVYPDGSQESRYSNGRIRLKDKDGRLVSDTGGS
ncbi:centromere protein J-like [Anopheles albimanus]|uniref:centromere protein J-like n=1 Tax=Anopheles albimanus TaxID=7167 RepID=UPI0016411430|nr:centromere protein J-like [Anopheles albimanus]